MAEFKEPRVGISKVYTRTGDLGETGLVGGQRVPKDDLRIEAYGTVDELNSWIGLCRAAALDPPAGPASDLAPALLRVQHQLFNLGSILATLPADVGPRQPRPTDADIAWLEAEMDVHTPLLPPLTSFVLPGGSRLNALLHLARTVCRRAERACVALRRGGGCSDLEVRYLNRLSDALFVWSRWAAHRLGTPETLWQPNQA
ncbi:MAG: cob(I)yrinic acid a,c-diamide adenosyltransferase [Halobacteriales archaeon]|nr:cob(I)yrinic acid a,c-diamide adenosyltransferase [Halobacteriales archaeon]